MKAIRLEPMGEDEFRVYRDAAVRWYAEDKQLSGDWAGRDALTLSLQAFHRLAPGGLRAPDQHFFTVHDAATGAKVGWLWFQVRDDGVNRSAYLCDLVIFEEYRRRGYGTACLTELDDRARGLGVGRVGLHVFGHNTGAVELYRRCGYKVTNHAMAKDLPEGAEPAAAADGGGGAAFPGSQVSEPPPRLSMRFGIEGPRAAEALMGAWHNQPCDNVAAADLFGGLFPGDFQPG